MDRIDLMAERRPDLWPLRDRIRMLGTDNLSHFGNGYTHEGGYSIQQNPDEFACLTLLLKERSWSWGGPRHGIYLEIGSASGGVLRWLFEQVGFGMFVSLDDGGHHRAPEQDANFAAVEFPTGSERHRHVERFRGDSHSDVAREFMRNTFAPQNRIHVAFIDGDHTYGGVKQDVELVRPFLAEGALVIFHDTVAVDDVRRAWEESSPFLHHIANYTGSERPLGIGVGVVR